MNIRLRNFESQILYFNGMYKLPISPVPGASEVIKNQAAKSTMFAFTDKEHVIQRLTDFKKIIGDEVNEVDDIIQKLKDDKADYLELDFLTDLADWLGDLQVYCSSEMAKFGLPIEEVLRIIMQSNFSKLGADGQPIYDATGKVQKGPMYWKPEPQIRAMLHERIMEAAANKGIVWSEEESRANETREGEQQ